MGDFSLFEEFPDSIGQNEDIIQATWPTPIEFVKVVAERDMVGLGWLKEKSTPPLGKDGEDD